jgi:hypothetical protein
MTPEDIRAIIREELAAAETRISANQDRAVEAIATEISTVREELSTRLSAVERELERGTESLRIVQLSLNNVNRWAEKLDKDQAALGQNYFDQRRAIEDLRRRVESLERKAS